MNSAKKAIQMVYNGDVYGFLDSSIVNNYYIQNEYINDLSITGKFEDNYKLSLGVNNEDKILHTILQKAILSLDYYTKESIINEWHKFNFIKKVDNTIFWQLLIVLFIITIIYLFVTINIKKRNEELKIRLDYEIEKSRSKDKIMFNKDKLNAMENMLENISHQWRQPLGQINSSIFALSNELNKNNNRSIIDKKLNEIEISTKYMSETITTFQNYNKIDLKYKKLNVSKCVSQSVRILQGVFTLNNIIIDIDFKENIYVFGIKNELQQAILVILNNAKDELILNKIKNPKITIKSKIKNNIFELRICDNGLGIKNEIINDIFKPYVSTKLDTNGTGLGLYLSKTILKNTFNADINAINNKVGVCFLISFTKFSIEESLNNE